MQNIPPGVKYVRPVGKLTVPHHANHHLPREQADSNQKHRGRNSRDFENFEQKQNGLRRHFLRLRNRSADDEEAFLKAHRERLGELFFRDKRLLPCEQSGLSQSRMRRTSERYGTTLRGRKNRGHHLAKLRAAR